MYLISMMNCIKDESPREKAQILAGQLKGSKPQKELEELLSYAITYAIAVSSHVLETA